MVESSDSSWRPIATAPGGAELEMSVYDDGEYHALVFPCRRDGRDGAMRVPIRSYCFGHRTGGGGNRGEHFNMAGRVELQDDFKEQAEWRREKAQRYPDDKRHFEAAASLIGWPLRSMIFRKTLLEPSAHQT
jgi:hypothetical protein